MKNRIEALKELNPKTLLAIASVSGGDGHTLFASSAYREAGMPAELVKAFTHTHKSDKRDPKSTIFADGGKVIEELSGVYVLEVVEAIAFAMGLNVGSFMGRGFRARAAFEAIQIACSDKEQDGAKGMEDACGIND